MGNTSSIDAPKERTSRQPTEQPLNPQPIFAEVLGETMNTIGRHDQGAPSLTVTPLPGDATVQLMTKEEIGRHDQGAPSLTITPLLGDATVQLMTMEEIGRLGPKRPKRSENLGEIRFEELNSERVPPKSLKFNVTLKGVNSEETQEAIEKVLEGYFVAYHHDFREVKSTRTEDAVEITFVGDQSATHKEFWQRKMRFTKTLQQR
jgi:hypothetical protein